MIHTFAIKGMHCASCAINIQDTLSKINGVASAEVNYATETAKIDFDSSKTNPQAFAKAIKPLGYTIEMPAEDHMPTQNHSQHMQPSHEDSESVTSYQLLVTLSLTFAAILIMTYDAMVKYAILPSNLIIHEFFHHLLPIFATYALFTVGKQYLIALGRFFRYGKANMDTLIGLGTFAAFAYSFIVSAFTLPLYNYINTEVSYYDVTIVVIGFITLGKYLEARAKAKTGDAIKKLLGLQAKTALVYRKNQEIEIAIEEVVIGDQVIVKPGTKIPVDGLVLDGTPTIDESMITGEPIPVEKTIGSNVVAGTINTTSAFTFEAKKIGKDTLLAHIIAMVQDAQGSKAPIQALADKISSIFVPTVLVLAIITLVTWLIIGTSYIGFPQALSSGIVSFVSILVIACPCALGLATPTAIIVGVGKAAKSGILIKDATSLEKLHKVTTIVFDKTGTITTGKPELVSKNEPEHLAILAGLESKSEHPIAHAIVTYATQNNVQIKSVTNTQIIKGQGMRGTINNKTYYAGNERLMKAQNITIDTTTIAEQTKKGYTPIFLASDNKLIDTFFIADTIKPTAKQSIAQLKNQHLKLLMLTGDDKNTATYIAEQAGINQVHAELLPQDKLTIIKKLQTKGEIVAMVGDGINDAPALAQSDIGIAMSSGTDIAIESAGITFLQGDISKLTKAIRLSHLTMAIIKQNLFWAFIYNIIGIPLAAGLFFPFFGWTLSPIFAGLAMALSSVSVVMNALRLKTKKI